MLFNDGRINMQTGLLSAGAQAVTAPSQIAVLSSESRAKRSSEATSAPCQNEKLIPFW